MISKAKQSQPWLVLGSKTDRKHQDCRIDQEVETVPAEGNDNHIPIPDMTKKTMIHLCKSLRVMHNAFHVQSVLDLCSLDSCTKTGMGNFEYREPYFFFFDGELRAGNVAK